MDKQIAEARHLLPEEEKVKSDMLTAIGAKCAEFKKKAENKDWPQNQMEDEMNSILQMVSALISVVKQQQGEVEGSSIFSAGVMVRLNLPFIALGEAFAIDEESHILAAKVTVLQCDACSDWHVDEFLPLPPVHYSYEDMKNNGIPLMFIIEGIEKHIFRSEAKRLAGPWRPKHPAFA